MLNRSNTRLVRQAVPVWVRYRPDRFADIPGKGMRTDRGMDNYKDKLNYSLSRRLSAQGLPSRLPNRLPSHGRATLRRATLRRATRHLCRATLRLCRARRRAPRRRAPRHDQRKLA